MHNKMIFSGTFEQCFEHYAQTLPNDKLLRRPSRQPMADFVCVLPVTIARCFSEKKFPSARSLFFFKHFFQLIGYDVTDLPKMHKEEFMLGQLITSQTIAVSEVVARLGYSEQHFWEALKEQKMLSGKRLLAQKLIKELRLPFEQKQAEWRQRAFAYSTLKNNQNDTAPKPPVVIDTSSKAPAPPAPVPAVKPTSNPDSHGGIISALAQLIKSAAPLATLVNSDEFSAEERRKLRDQCDVNLIFDFTNNMLGLSGEKSRERAKG